MVESVFAAWSNVKEKRSGVGSGALGSKRDVEPSGGARGVKMIVQRSIVPGPVALIGQPLEPIQKRLRELRSIFLILRIAKIDAAAQGARVSGRAAPVRVLPRARLARVETSRGARRQAGQKYGFGRGQKESMPIFAKPATTARNRAGRIQVGHRLVNVLVKLAKLDPDFGQTMGFVKVVMCLF
jgi:hypothetical protein